MNQENYVLSLKRIRNAYLFLLLNINIGTLNLLPEWVAFVLIGDSLNEIGMEEKSALLLKGFSNILCKYHFVVWVLDIFMVSFDYYIVTVFFSIMQLYLNFQLMTNIIDISIKHHSNYTNKLKNVRNIVTILFTLSSVVSFYPISNIVSDSGILTVVVTIEIIVFIMVSIIQIIDLSSYIKEEQAKI